MKRVGMLAGMAAMLCVCGWLPASRAAVGRIAAASDPWPAPSTRPSGGKLTVHEWGTFTGLVGSDGVHLPFGVDIGADLPPFVQNRLSQAQRLGVKPPIGLMFIKGNGATAVQRMETPVIYFYTERPRDVSVRVDFPQGLLTEFYPPVREMGPAFGLAPGEEGKPAALSPTTQPAAAARPTPQTQPAADPAPPSFLDWGDVHLIPTARDEPIAGQGAAQTVSTSAAGGREAGAIPSAGPSLQPESVPPVTAESERSRHYGYARETDSAMARIADHGHERHQEKFLFYRGLGNFALPVRLIAKGDGQFELTNSGADPIRFALLLRIADGRARFAVYREIKAAAAMTLPTAAATGLVEVEEAIAHALVAEGLYEKEARAMVKTWSASWLREPGTRVLYLVPRAAADHLLPLRITPTPDETVRVLVGRIDILTPEQEAKIDALLSTAIEAKAIPPTDAADLRALGRFLLPTLTHVASHRTRPASGSEVNALWRLVMAAASPSASQPPSPPASR